MKVWTVEPWLEWYSHETQTTWNTSLHTLNRVQELQTQSQKILFYFEQFQMHLLVALKIEGKHEKEKKNTTTKIKDNIIKLKFFFFVKKKKPIIHNEVHT